MMINYKRWPFLLLICIVTSLSCKDANDPQFGDEPVFDVDNNRYNVVAIGNQFWFKENLKTTRYRNGDEIRNYTTSTNWDTLQTGVSLAYDMNEAYVETYGRLYNWHAVDDSRQLCPNRWRVPTKEDWTELIDNLGGVSSAGGKLKETGESHWQAPNDGATNTSEFSALPGGRFPTSDYVFLKIKTSGAWWSSTEERDLGIGYTIFNKGYGLPPGNTGEIINQYADHKNIAFSIRCIADA